MALIIGNKKYDPETSQPLYSRGDGQAAFRRDGQLTVFRSPENTIWAVLTYWPMAYGPQERETAAGIEDVKRLCTSLNRLEALEAIGAAPEDG